MPAHKLVLMAKSTYFNTRLSTVVGENSLSSRITEVAGSVDEIRAMEAVVEFMYTDQLSTYCTQNLEPDGNLSLTKRLLLVLVVRCLASNHYNIFCNVSKR